MTIFDEMESEVRYYCRQWPTMFVEAAGSTLTDSTGRQFIDFFSGAGALSYGHNDAVLQDAVVDHFNRGGLIHSLDMHTPEKAVFLAAVRDRVLAPRDLDMVVQCVGPTGATGVEAALKLAEKATGRRSVVAFDGGFHGMTDRAASVSDSTGGTCEFLPYVERSTNAQVAYLNMVLETLQPGALVIEAVQGEAGGRPFDADYLSEVRQACTEHGTVLIADEVQAGVGRCGPFFSFEGSGLDPDVICLSKSLSGLGLPLAVNLIRRSLDLWSPGEFSGTFRGNNLAFVTSAAMLNTFWSDDTLEQSVLDRGKSIRSGLDWNIDSKVHLRGKGFLWGLDFQFVGAGAAERVADEAFRNGLLVETCGANGSVVKLLPALTISDSDLANGLDLLVESINSVI